MYDGMAGCVSEWLGVLLSGRMFNCMTGCVSDWLGV